MISNGKKTVDNLQHLQYISNNATLTRSGTGLKMKIIAGNSNLPLANAIAKHCFATLVPANVKTFADGDLLEKYIQFKPKTSVLIGIKNFIDWYKNYYQIN